MWKILIAALFLTAAAPAAAVITEAEAAAAIADPTRLDFDRERDADRMPAKVIAFMQLEEGDRVLDWFAGSGYFTQPIAKLVGPEGFVLAQNPPGYAADPQIRAAVEARGYGEAIPNAAEFNMGFGQLQLAPGSLDNVLFHLVYHDLYWQSERLPRVEPQLVLAEIHRALKPGGTVTVVDHVGTSDDPRAEVDATHRIDPEIVLRDFRRAGFRLVERQEFFENPDDDRTLGVFDERVRGRTDRFAMRFAKAEGPAAEAEIDDPNEDVPVAGAGECDAAAAEVLVGRPYGDALRDEAKALSGAETVRAYGPGDAVTMDYRTDRLNLELDEDGTIVRVTCG